MTCPQCGMKFTPKRKEQKYCSTECSYIDLREKQKGWFAEKRINPKYQFSYVKNYENKR